MPKEIEEEPSATGPQDDRTSVIPAWTLGAEDVPMEVDEGILYRVPDRYVGEDLGFREAESIFFDQRPLDLFA